MSEFSQLIPKIPKNSKLQSKEAKETIETTFCKRRSVSMEYPIKSALGRCPDIEVITIFQLNLSLKQITRTKKSWILIGDAVEWL